MGQRLDLAGRTFGRLFVISLTERRDSSGNVFWLCKCICGNSVVVRAHTLKSGHTRSCGCLHVEAARKQGLTGATHGMSDTVEYQAFRDAWNRVNNPNVRNYSEYGGRGITFEFLSFEEFYEAVGPRPEGVDNGRSLWSLDRIDNDGPYVVGNVKWSSRSEQMHNRRPYKHKKNR